MKFRTLAASAAAVALALGVVGLSALPASAHTPSITASCEKGVTAKATAYDGKRENRWTITVGGVTESGTFGASLNKTIPVPQDSAVTSWSATIEAHDGGYRQSLSGTVGPCGVKTVTAPTIEVTPPTCLEPGGIPITANPPAQNPNGYELPGQGARVYLSPGFTGPGTYTATIQKIGPGFDPAFPNGTKIVGSTSQTLTVLPATGFQGTDEAALCYVPVPPTKIVETEWVGEFECGDTTVTETRQVTETRYELDPVTGTVNSTSGTSTEERTRDLTEAEIASLDCTPPPPVLPECPEGEEAQPAGDGYVCGPIDEPNPEEPETPTTPPVTPEEPTVPTTPEEPTVPTTPTTPTKTETVAKTIKIETLPTTGTDDDLVHGLAIGGALLALLGIVAAVTGRTVTLRRERREDRLEAIQAGEINPFD